MKKNTKIIATLGPATNNKRTLEKLYKNGVNIIRFNFSHANYEDATKSIEIINELNKSGKTNLSLLLDTKGPEIRTGDLENKIVYKKGEKFKIYVDPKHKLSGNELFCDYPYLAEDLKVGKEIVLDSGLLSVKVLEKGKDYLLVSAGNTAIIGSRRHVNLPGVKLKLPGITEKDRQDIIFGIENNFSFIAASFIRNAKNVKEIRDLFDKYKCSDCKIISKIENQEAIDNIDEIIEESDGVMVARGDLGIEVPIRKLAVYQKMILEKTQKRGRVSIIATHLLESMIDNPFPTRAETSDIFNGVLQKPDCLMLSGETAIGNFPIETVKMMTSIIKEAEKSMDYEHDNYSDVGLSERDIEKKLLIRSGVFVGEKLKAKTMIVLTKSGLLARLASGFRPSFPVYSFTPSANSMKKMNILFGINPLCLKEWNEIDFTITLEAAIKYLLGQKVIKKDDKIIAINDIQKNGHEIPIMEIIDLKHFLSK